MLRKLKQTGHIKYNTKETRAVDSVDKVRLKPLLLLRAGDAYYYYDNDYYYDYYYYYYY